MPEIIGSVDFWKFALPLLGAVAAWFANEWRKRVADQYQRKEANYKELIRSLRGFYVEAANANELKLEFLNQLNVSWLYCPDNVIRLGYKFLESVQPQQTENDQEKRIALGAFVSAVREDLLPRRIFRTTTLSAEDFRHFTVHKS